jgi:FKBP-type peptidyl-prolyl cis-trans isomerase FkpA
LALFLRIVIITLVLILINKFMNKKTTIAIVISVVVVGVLIGGGLISGLFTNSNNKQDTTMQKQSDQVQAKDTTVGTGDVAVAGKQVTVNYTGVFSDGKVFDSSVGKVPFTFTLGAGQVIKGWDIGVEGMKVGGKRILIIPPQFGYGDKDYGPIPASSTLIFEIELLGVK